MKQLLFYILLATSTLSYSVLCAKTTSDCDTLKAPVISSEKQVSCSGQPVVLKATGCDGTIVWSNQKTGGTLTIYPSKTTAYNAHCKKSTCKSSESNTLIITVNIPPTPLVKANKTRICLGEIVILTTTGCANDIIWSNGMTGKEITVQPINTTKYTATCRTEGCVSCFADEVVVVVAGGEPLLLTSPKSVVCKGESLFLNAQGNCTGKIKWSTGATGKNITVKPDNTTEYWALCETEGCEPVKSSVNIQVSPPLAPVLKADKNTICFGENVILKAENCSGAVLWSNGMSGSVIKFQPNESAQYTAVCVRGDCRSIASAAVAVAVGKSRPAVTLIKNELNNTCPYTTVDLSAALPMASAPNMYYEARTGATPDAPLVVEVGAVSENRTFYIFGRDADGCYSPPATVAIKITACDKPLAVCINNPATAIIEKTEQTTAGNYFLQGKIGGAANTGNWSSNGTGTFNTLTGLSAVYSPSLEDRQAGKVTIRFMTDDPDGDGPCKSGSALAELKTEVIPNKSEEMIGVNKLVKSWKRLSMNLFEIEYTIQVVNMGVNNLVEVRIIDSLDKVFKSGAVIVGKPVVVAFDPVSNTKVKWGIDTNYTGKDGLYDLLVPAESQLLAGQARSVTIQAKIDFTNAQDSVFYNLALVSALDINGNLCQDKSVNGNWPDLDQNQDPTNDTEPTPIALSNLRGNYDDIFIPEGFSPNADGINDYFVVKKPSSLQCSLEVYNRWGGLVYKTENYKNDWNGGTVAQNSVPTGTYFYIIKFSDGREFSRFLTISR